jgi:hypothetical protein
MCGGGSSLPAEVFLDEFPESIFEEDGIGDIVKEGVCSIGRVLTEDEAEGMNPVKLTGTESRYAYGCTGSSSCEGCKYAAWNPESQQFKEAQARRESARNPAD